MKQNIEIATQPVQFADDVLSATSTESFIGAVPVTGYVLTLAAIVVADVNPLASAAQIIDYIRKSTIADIVREAEILESELASQIVHFLLLDLQDEALNLLIQNDLIARCDLLLNNAAYS